MEGGRWDYRSTSRVLLGVIDVEQSYSRVGLLAPHKCLVSFGKIVLARLACAWSFACLSILVDAVLCMTMSLVSRHGR